MNEPSLIERFCKCSLLLAGLFLAACATVPSDTEPPKISIANIAPKDVTIFEQRFDVQLRIQNPNEKELGINGIRFDIDLNEHEFANGMSGENVTIPRFSSQVLNVEVITGISSFLRQFQEFNKTGSSKLRYRIKGTAFVEAPRTFKLPFDEKGEVDFGFGEVLEPQQ